MLCEDCSTPLTETISDYVCPSCGLVAGQKVVESSYQKNEGNFKTYGTQAVEEGNKSSNVNQIGSFLGYYNNWNISDYQGKYVVSSKNTQFRRLKRINDIYTQSHGKERLYRSLRLLAVVSGVLELPDSIKEDSARIFRNCYKKLLDIRVADLTAASVYLASRLNHYNLRVKDLLQSFENEGVVVQGKNILYAATQIRILTGYKVKSTTSEEYLERVIQALINDDEFKIKLQKQHISNMEYGILLRKTSQEILKKLSRDLRGGRDPYALACATVAGADLTIANNFGKRRGFATQRLIARVGDVAEYTLREHFLQIIKKVIDKSYIK
jgi:transcription initiation factor TFIIIB Brf1 subunit/transcription initiation factor TFIIB